MSDTASMVPVLIPARLVVELRELLGPGPAWTWTMEPCGDRIDWHEKRGAVCCDEPAGHAGVHRCAHYNTIWSDPASGAPFLTEEEAIAIAVAGTSAELYLQTLQRDHPEPDDEAKEWIANCEHQIATLKGLLSRNHQLRVAEVLRAERGQK